jgi:hypothetical protein
LGRRHKLGLACRRHDIGDALVVGGIWSVKAQARCAVDAAVISTQSSELNVTISLARADFNGDHKMDILWRDTATGQLYIWLMDGAVSAGAGSPGTVSDPTWQIRGIADFNGDGRTDILWNNVSTGMIYVWLMNGTAAIGQGSPGALGPNWQIKN